MLENLADWIAEETKDLGIPLMILSASQARAPGGASASTSTSGRWAAATRPRRRLPDRWWSSWPGEGPQPAALGREAAASADYLGKNHNSNHGDVRIWQAKMQTWGGSTPARSTGYSGRTPSRSRSASKPNRGSPRTGSRSRRGTRPGRNPRPAVSLAASRPKENPVRVTTPPPGDWKDGGPVRASGPGPSGTATWETATTDGARWSAPVQAGTPGHDLPPAVQPPEGGVTLPEPPRPRAAPGRGAPDRAAGRQ